MSNPDTANMNWRFLRFRILIIGKANAGKTTILEKICDTKDKPVVTRKGRGIDPTFELEKSTAMRGIHDIYNEITYPSRPGLVFHDSCGFEAGSTTELDNVNDFVAQKSGEPVLAERVHVIWYCLPTDNDRPLSKAEMSLFEYGTGSVPVIAIFTKFDGLETKAFVELREKMSRTDARKEMHNRTKELFQERFLDRLKETKYPPASYLCLGDMQKPEISCDELVKQTIEVLDNDTLEQLFLSAQQAKVTWSMEYGLKRALLEPYIFSRDPFTLTEEGVKPFIAKLLSWFPHLWNELTFHNWSLSNFHFIYQGGPNPKYSWFENASDFTITDGIFDEFPNQNFVSGVDLRPNPSGLTRTVSDIAIVSI